MSQNQDEDALRRQFAGVSVRLPVDARAVLGAARAARRRQVAWMLSAGAVVVALAVVASVLIVHRLAGLPGPNRSIDVLGAPTSTPTTPSPDLDRIQHLAVADIASINVTTSTAYSGMIKVTDPDEIGTIVDFLAKLRVGGDWMPIPLPSASAALRITYADGAMDSVSILADAAIQVNGGPTRELLGGGTSALDTVMAAIRLTHFQSDYAGRIVSGTVVDVTLGSGVPVISCAVRTDAGDRTVALSGAHYYTDTSSQYQVVVGVGDTVQVGLGADGRAEAVLITAYAGMPDSTSFRGSSLDEIQRLAVADIASLTVSTLPELYPTLNLTDAADITAVTDYLASLHPGAGYKAEPLAGMAYVLVVTYLDGTSDMISFLGTYLELNGGLAHDLSLEEANAFHQVLGAIRLRHFESDYAGRILSGTAIKVTAQVSHATATCTLRSADGTDTVVDVSTAGYIIDVTDQSWLLLHAGDSVKIGLGADGRAEIVYITGHADSLDPNADEGSLPEASASSGPTTAATVSDSPSPSGVAGPPVSYPAGQVTPGNATPNGDSIVVQGGRAQPDAVTLDFYLDYQCPQCRQAVSAVGPALAQLVGAGKVLVRYHLLTFLNEPFANKASTLTAMAASCADTEGAFQAYSDALFANQPTKEGTGFTDQQLRDGIARQAGLSGDALTRFQGCYDNAATAAFVAAMQTANTGRNAVPAFEVNGVPIEDWILLPTSADALNAYLRQVAASPYTPVTTTP